MTSNEILEEPENRPGKADFDHIYDQEEPRQYYRTLARFDYQIPRYVQRVFGSLIEERAERDGRPPRVLDLACSYGINSAILKYEGVTFDSLAKRYESDELQRMSVEEVIASDRTYFAEREIPGAPTIYGCDVASNAVRYGERVGLLERGWAVNLETDSPSPDLCEILKETDLITVSSAIGYLTYRTINEVLSQIPQERRPWFAGFALRTAPIDPVAHALRDFGLELATLQGLSVRQRRFVDEEEMQTAIESVRRRGYVVEGHESDGYWHASLYVGMPADEKPVRMMGLIDG